MNNYKKRRFLEYLVKLLPVYTLTTYDESPIQKTLLHEYDIKKDVKSFLKKESKKTSNFVPQGYIDYIKKYSDSLKKSNTLLEKKMLILKKFFSLDELEYQVFEFLCLYCLSSGTYTENFCNLGKCLQENYYKRTCHDTVILAKYLFGIGKITLFKIFHKFKECGLVEAFSYKSPSFNCLSDGFRGILVDEHIITEKQLKAAIIGKPERPSLKWSDFDYLGAKRYTVLKILKSAIETKQKGINILFYGKVGTGKTELAKVLAKQLKYSLYSVLSCEEGWDVSRRARLNDLQVKQKVLSMFGEHIILFDEAEDALRDKFIDNESSKAYLNNLIENCPIPVIWTTNYIADVDAAYLRRMTYAIEFEDLSDEIRLNIWKKAVKKASLKIEKQKLIELSKSYNVQPSIIANAVNTTKIIGGTQDDFEMFLENSSRLVNRKSCPKTEQYDLLANYSNEITNTDLDLRNLTQKIKNSGNYNFSLCLFGESGTGKSLYARHLADELGLKVILKKASDLKSKWVGETEQNIAKAFEEATSEKAMLIFDEADSFLKQRDGSMQSHEIASVNEMLTQMESFKYPFVCTTNLMDVLDEASLRRFLFKIRFDFMTEDMVNTAMKHFFNIDNANVHIKGLTAGDFSTVKRKAEFLSITDVEEIKNMLEQEVKVKKSKSLQNSIGFAN